MVIDVDLIQRVKVSGLFALQIYKVVTGTMLSLFIPQSCYDEIQNTTAICTLQENIEDTEVYHQTAFYVNCVSLFAFLVTYALEMKRENWAIQYLDIDNDIPDNALQEIIVEEPRLNKQMDKINALYWYSLLITSGIYTINLGMTGKILYDRYHSSTTISCFISFVLLVLMKLYNSLYVAHQSVKNDKMMSAYMSEFTSYNILDADYIESKETLTATNKVPTNP